MIQSRWKVTQVWASNYFNISTGAVLANFNTGTPTTAVKGLTVKRIQ